MTHYPVQLHHSQNSVKKDGPDLILRDRTIPAQRSLFQKGRIALMVGSNRKMKFVEEFDDVLVAFDDGVQGFVANAASSAYQDQSRPVISDEFSVARLGDEAGRRPAQPGGRRTPGEVAPELRRREDEIYRFSSDFHHFARATTLRKIGPLKAE